MTPSKLGLIYMIGWRPKRKKTKIIKMIDPLTNLIKEKNEGPISWLAIAMRANNEFAAKADIVKQITIEGNKRISDETVKIYGEIDYYSLPKNYCIKN